MAECKCIMVVWQVQAVYETYQIKPSASSEANCIKKCCTARTCKFKRGNHACSVCVCVCINKEKVHAK